MASRTSVNGPACPAAAGPTLSFLLYGEADVKSPEEPGNAWTGTNVEFVRFQKKQLKRKTSDIVAKRNAAKKYVYRMLDLNPDDATEENEKHDITSPLSDVPEGVVIVPYILTSKLSLRTIFCKTCNPVIEAGYYARIIGDGLKYPKGTMLFYGDLVIGTLGGVVHFESAVPASEDEGGVFAEFFELYNPRLGVGSLRGIATESKNAVGNEGGNDMHLSLTRVVVFPEATYAKDVKRSLEKVLEEHVDYTIRTVIAINEDNDSLDQSGVQMLQKNAREWSDRYKQLLETDQEFFPILWEHTVAARDLAVAMHSNDTAKNQAMVKLLFENLERVVQFHVALGYDQATIRNGWAKHLQTTVAYYNSLWDSKGGANSSAFRGDALHALKLGQQMGATLESATLALRK